MTYYNRQRPHTFNDVISHTAAKKIFKYVRDLLTSTLTSYIGKQLLRDGSEVEYVAVRSGAPSQQGAG